MKWPKRKRDRIGMTCETAMPIKNRITSLPAGARVKIVGWYRGAEISTERCPACGVSVYITRVPERDLIPIAMPEKKCESDGRH